MARIFHDGFEINSVASGGVNVWSTVSGTPTLSSTTVRTGTFSGRVSSLASATAKGWLFKWAATTAAGPFWLRAYLNIAVLPSAANHIMSFNAASGSAGATPRCMIKLNADGTLTLHDSAGTQIGSPSSALSTGTWYMVDLKMDHSPASGSRITEARLNGSIFATSSTQTDGNAFAFSVGGNLSLEAQTTGDWFFDDIAINDNTGVNQTSYPGSGKVFNLWPNATGDANAFDTQTGGTAGAANNFTRVNENPPDSATTFNGTATLNNEDLFNVTNSGIGASDTVNVVMVGGQFRNNVADAVAAIKFEIEKASAGTIFQSAAIIPNTTGWNINAINIPRNYPIILYADPDGAAWTQATLDTMQIGYKLTAANVNRIDVSNVFAVIDYTPAAVVTAFSSTFNLLGAG